MSAAYAGIGARDAPPEALELIEAVAGALAGAGWVLRSGGSPGADVAFYSGALDGGGAVELYLPWPGFGSESRRAREQERDVSELMRPAPQAYPVAAAAHRAFAGPPFAELGQREQALLARDVHQVLGADLRTPVQKVVCWTACGTLDGEDPRAQGTGQALRVARRQGVPVSNLGRPGHAERWRSLLRSLPGRRPSREGE